MSPRSSSSSSSTATTTTTGTSGGLLIILIVAAAIAVAWLQTRIVPTTGVPPVVVTLVLAPAIAVVAFRIFRDGKKNDDDSSSRAAAGEEEASEVVEVSPASPVKPKKKKKKRTKIKPSKHPRYVRRFAGHTGIIHDMSPSPNGEWMATSGADGQIRVTMVESKGDPQHQVYLRANVENKDVATSLSWCPDNRTLACTFKNCADVAFYRMRKKHDADEIKKQKPSAFPYELVELPKRRFSIASKMEDKYGDVTDCVVDSSHSNYTLILTACTDRTAAAWDGRTGDCVATVRTGSEGVILSPNGSLLCGRPGDAHGGKSSNEVKIYEIHRTRRKGDAEPVFDKIPHKSVMTIVANVKVVDVAFGGARDGERCDVAVVCGVDGSVQLWDLDVEYRFGGANPKLLCSTTVPPGEEDGEVKKIVAVAATAAGGGDGSATTAAATRVAVATDDSALHLFTYSPVGDDHQRPSISSDFTIDDTHPEGVGDVRFCPSSSGKVLYTRSAASKEVFAWNVE